MLAALVLWTQVPEGPVPPIPIRGVPIRAELRLSVDRPTVTGDGDPGYHATIRNLGRVPLRLSDLQPGSTIGGVNPSVDWITPDLRTPREWMACGNTDAIDTGRFFTLAPGASRELSPAELGLAELSPGVNRVRLVYAIEAKTREAAIFGMVFTIPETPEEAARIEADRAAILARYRALTPIRLTSNTVRVTLKSAP